LDAGAGGGDLLFQTQKQLLALSFQPSAFSLQLSAFSYQLSAFSYQLSAFSFQLSAIGCKFAVRAGLLDLWLEG
jgi:hypothetical protein